MNVLIVAATYLVLSIAFYAYLRKRTVQMRPALNIPLFLNLLRAVRWTPAFIADYGFALPAIIGGVINSQVHLLGLNWLLILSV